MNAEWATRSDIERIDQRLDRGDSRFDRLEEEIKASAAMTRQACEDTGEMLEFFRAMKGAFKVFDWIGKLAKPLAAIVALGAALIGLWTASKSGFPPHR